MEQFTARSQFETTNQFKNGLESKQIPARRVFMFGQAYPGLFTYTNIFLIVCAALVFQNTVKLIKRTRHEMLVPGIKPMAGG